MNLPNGITASRIALSPLFFLVFFVPLWTGVFLQGSIVVIWLIFVWVEVSDMLDGEVARRTGQVTDLGKVLDPFADVIARLTYFVCLTAANLMPVWVFVIIMYREFGIIFIRMMMYRKGVALAARKGGKLKTVTYSIASGLGMLLSSFARLDLFEPLGGLGLFAPLPLNAGTLVSVTAIGAMVFYVIAAVLSLLSFVDYLRVFRGSGAGSA